MQEMWPMYRSLWVIEKEIDNKCIKRVIENKRPKRKHSFESSRVSMFCIFHPLHTLRSHHNGEDNRCDSSEQHLEL
jgi:hypothetical protein